MKNKYTFAAFKVIFLVWTMFFAGALEQYKTSLVVDYGNHTIIYTSFWIVFIGVAYIFKSFWEVRNFEQFEAILDKLHLMFLIPVFIIIYGLLFLLFLKFTSINTGFIALIFTIPLSSFVAITWVTKFKETNVIKSMKDSLTME